MDTRQETPEPRPPGAGSRDTPERSRRTFLFGVGCFAAAILIPKVPKLFVVENSPLVLPPSPLSGGNRIGNRRVYMWLVKDPKEKGGVRFMEKFGSPPASAEDGSRVAVLCNENAYRKYDMGMKSSTDEETGQAFFYDDKGVEWHGTDGIPPGRFNDQVHVLPKETAEAFAKRAFEAERMQWDGKTGSMQWPKVPKSGEVYKVPSKNARIVIHTAFNDGKSLVAKRSVVVP